ncbi:EEF1A lysine methyltransferase 1 [Harmonia axyridis]|uniref:EEF1A lysine methyltransferase 1 n=1 Tax=Harmonia axyridis TaxID=115357 RepID=UPI001E274F27|nr:EEF1A lysine methyltransferase 1 [Harmonia axyridis]
MSCNSDDDDIPQLSIETFAVLQEFYKEQEERELMRKNVDSDTNIQENWQLSQFWYDHETIEKLTSIILKSVGHQGKIALISCPSIYPMLASKIGENGEVEIYEYDRRFSIYGNNFKFYDYNKPLEVPENRTSYYDLVIADPPFLSEECLSKTADTIKCIARNKIILCTGAVMAPIAEKLLNLKKTDFEPRHKNNLANEFGCFTNFDINVM